MDRQYVEELVEDLSRRFREQHERPLGEPLTDLKVMRGALFDPVAREERLRRELETLRTRLDWPPPPRTPETITLPIGDDAWLITPEGRLAIPALTSALANQADDEVIVDELDISAAEHALATTYREWTRYRLGRVLSLREGRDRPMLPAAIGTTLFLLVNGNIGEEWALAQPKDAEKQRQLDSAVTAPIQEFVSAIDPGSRGPESDRRHLQLYNGYGLSEARRRLGSDIVLEKDPSTGEGKGKRLYIRDGSEERITDALARELWARQVSPEILQEAIDRMLAVYEEQRPRIAAFGVSNAMQSRTRQLRESLLQRP